VGSQVFLALSACLTLQASLAPAGSPLFTYHPLHACRGYGPRKHRSSLAIAAAVILPSPQGTAGRLLHNRSISGLFIPFTDVPAYVLPVYASPGTLPSPTQDSVPDCWLRFVRAAIADGWTICACKAQPPQNGTCSRIGRQRVAPMGTFPTTLLRTARESFDLKPLSSDCFQATLG